jgi:hypothetical protein
MTTDRGPYFSLSCTVLAFLLLAVSGLADGAVLPVPGDFATIQAAVDAAQPGDEIVVAAGIYEEQVVIDKDVTLTGAGRGLTVLLAPPYMPYTVHVAAYNAVVHVEPPAHEVTIRDLTVDGANRGRVDTRFTGIIYDRVGGICERVEITRLTETPVSAALSGIGFYSFSEFGDGLALTTRDVVIRDFQKTGFVCFGSGCAQTVERVTADASTLNTDAVQNGFELLLGTSGTLTDCVARHCWYDGDPQPGLTACGYILYYGDPWTLTDCVADENQTAIYSIATDLYVRGAKIDVYPVPLEFNNGIAVTTSPYVASRNDGQSIGAPRVVVEGGQAAAFPAADYVFDVRDSVVRGHQIATSSGLTCYSNFTLMGATIEGCLFDDWDASVRMLEAGGGQLRAQARTCRFLNSIEYAAFTATKAPFDARGNDWGDPSGPLHPISNPGGLGGLVSDNVVYDPWLTGNLAVSPVPQYIAQDDADAGGFSDEVAVRYIGGAADLLYGFSVELTWDQARLTGGVADVQRPLTGPFAAAPFFQVLPIAGGVRIDAALGGNTGGVDQGDLLRLRLHLVGAPDYTPVPIDIALRHARNNQNLEIAGFTPVGGLVIGDVVAPVVTSLVFKNETLAHTDSYAKNGDQISLTAIVNDGDPLFGIPYMWANLVQALGAIGWQRPPDIYAAPIATWDARPAELYPPDGTIPYGVTVFDPAGNHATYTSTFIADNTPPQPITGFTAAPGHNRVRLHWDDPTATDANLRHVTVRAEPWGDYPLYMGAGPAYPADPAAGDDAFTGVADNAVVVYAADGSERDIVYFQAFAVDMVDLASPALDIGRDRATNYWLGDVSEGGGPVYDGEVDIWDVSQLGDTFGLLPGEPGFDAECDIGPTDDASELGIPLPDREIGFEDLMIFAIQFENFLPLLPPLAGRAPAALTWTRDSDLVWSLRLAQPCASLKGLHLTTSLPAGIDATVQAGALLTGQLSPHFLHAGRARLDVSLAVLGRGAAIVGSGELLRVVTSSPVGVLKAAVEARDLANDKLPTNLCAPLGGLDAAAPAVFRLHGAAPNPFNPATEIAFDLPAAQPVKLVVYSLAGRRVATLVDANLPAGRHLAAWRGQDDAGRGVAAGTYVYLLEAGPFTASGKLNLVK